MKWLKSLSKRQRIALAGVVALFLLGLVVPYQSSHYNHTGYIFIFLLPSHAHVDVARVAIPMFVVVCATIAGVLLTKEKAEANAPAGFYVDSHGDTVDERSYREHFRS